MFLTENDINYYLYAKPPRFWIALSVCIVAGLGFAFFAVRHFVRWIYSVPLLLFTNASPAMAERLRREGIKTTDRFLEDFFGEDATLERLLLILGRLGTGSAELMCHPAVVDDELRAGSGYAEPRARELLVLTSAEAKRAIRDAGIELVHFGEL